MSNRCLCSRWQRGHRRMQSKSKRLRAPELNMWLIRMFLSSVHSPTVYYDSVSPSRSLCLLAPCLNNNQCNLLHLWWRLAPRTPLPSPTLSLSQNSRALCPSLSTLSVDEIAGFCQTSSPCPVVSLTCLYFCYCCCCCCSPFLGLKKTNTGTCIHAVLLPFFISFGGRTIILGNICRNAQATFLSSLWMAFTPTFMARHTQPSSAVVQLFSLPLAGLKGCHRFAEKPNWKHDVIPTSHVPPLSLCVSLSLSLSISPYPPFLLFTLINHSEKETFLIKRERNMAQ